MLDNVAMLTMVEIFAPIAVLHFKIRVIDKAISIKTAPEIRVYTADTKLQKRISVTIPF